MYFDGSKQVDILKHTIAITENPDRQSLVFHPVSKYFINFGMLMAFPIFDIYKYFLYNLIEKLQFHRTFK